MAQQYLLPCKCGKVIPVTVAQAGRTLDCSCGQELRVPTLAGIRQLDPAELEATNKTRPPAAWNALRGGLFVAGVIAATIGLALGGYASSWLRVISVADAKEYTEHMESHILENVDKMTPLELYDNWKKVQAMSGPGVLEASPLAQVQKFYDYWLWMAIVGFTIAGLGILMAASSLINVRPALRG